MPDLRLLIIIAYEVTSSVLSSCLLCLAMHDEWQQRLSKAIISSLEPKQEQDGNDNGEINDLIEAYIYEVMRLYGPCLYVERVAGKNFHFHVECIGDFYIPQDNKVRIALHALHHSEEFWPQADRFDPERFLADQKSNRKPFTYMPFGIGNRHCVGIKLAMSVIKSTLTKLIEKYRFHAEADIEQTLRYKSTDFFSNWVLDSFKMKFQKR